MIVILFCVSVFFMILSGRRFQLKLLSLTFWSSLMFSVCSFVYICSLSTMKSDISVKTLFVVIGFLSVTAVGELLATKCKLSKASANNCQITTTEAIYIPRKTTYFLTILFLIVAGVRLYNLILVAMSVSGNGFTNIIEMLSVARQAYINVDGSVVLSNVVLNQLVYVSEIATYIFLFTYMHNAMLCGKKNLYLLLPLIPDFILRLVTTTRSAFIMLIFVIIIFYVYLRQKAGQSVFRVPKKLIVIFVLFCICFIAYGLARNNVSGIGIMQYIEMYSCSGIFGLDRYLEFGWSENPYFGFHTLQNIYDLFGVDRAIKLSWDEFFVFDIYGTRSNLYTALASPIQDYGVVGMLVLRFLEALIGGFIVSKFNKKKMGSHSFYLVMYFALITIYCYLWAPIGNIFNGYFGSPDMMIRYLIYGYFLIKLIKPCKYASTISINKYKSATETGVGDKSI